eukprot:GDKH01025059.1.p1 GENE.GDKH01025059.1~~GDKH01025059.1.p1  ORF type:complete len:192 (-),score=15.64 GDKH01025059.1:45-620(-)
MAASSSNALPECVRKTLENCNFAVAATANNMQPHVSLLNFSYVDQEQLRNIDPLDEALRRDLGVLIFTTRTDTKKLHDIIQNPKLSILVHDFGGLRGDPEPDDSTFGDQRISVTLSGEAAPVLDANAAEAFRKLHSERNPGMAQFIEGKEIVVVRFGISHVSYSNSSNEVRTWTPQDPSFVPLVEFPSDPS